MEFSSAIEQKTHRKNLLQLVYLRSIAISGQLFTIFSVRYGLHIMLPIPAMLCVIGFLFVLNGVTFYRYKAGREVTSTELLIALLLDAAALTVQLYLSGGAANPFVSLFLLQVIIGAILLSPRYAWTLFIATLVCYLCLTFHVQALKPIPPHHVENFFYLHIHGMLVSYTLAAFLLVFFITRISANLKERDMLLAKLKQQSQDAEHVIHMGLLAAGAAHELGTPLTTISVILKDWQSLSIPDSGAVLNEDIEMIQREVARCKDIVSSILLSAGQVRGEAAEMVPLADFIRSVAENWRAARRPPTFTWQCTVDDIPIISDKIIRQTLSNLLDNAFEASPDWVNLDLTCDGEAIIIRVEDRGAGFSAHALKSFGTPYASTKAGHGRGLGLFLVVNTLRKLGGNAHAENIAHGGAAVTLHIPLSSVSARSS